MNPAPTIVLFLLLTSVGLVIGCSSSKDVSAERAAARRDTLNAYEKEFDTSKYDVKEPKSSAERVIPRPKNPITATSETIRGFRVQVFQSTNIEQANQVKNDISLLLGDEEIYMHYDPPYYKVRVGDFSTRPDATKMVNLLAEKGYKDAWVVPDRVYKR
jgi:cell division protein FtsN